MPKVPIFMADVCKKKEKIRESSSTRNQFSVVHTMLIWLSSKIRFIFFTIMINYLPWLGLTARTIFSGYHHKHHNVKQHRSHKNSTTSWISAVCGLLSLVGTNTLREAQRELTSPSLASPQHHSTASVVACPSPGSVLQLTVPGDSARITVVMDMHIASESVG